MRHASVQYLTGYDVYSCESQTQGREDAQLMCLEGVIKIKSATYTNKKVSQCRSFATNPIYSFCAKEVDHTWAAKQVCDGLRKCEYHGTDRFGDPCPKIAKYTKITYDCVPQTNDFQAISCAGELAGQPYAELFCPGGRIVVDSAKWSGNLANRCNLDKRFKTTPKCGEVDHTYRVRATCNGQQYCAIRGSNEHGDPCPGTRKVSGQFR